MNAYTPTPTDLAKWPCRRGPSCANHPGAPA